MNPVVSIDNKIRWKFENIKKVRMRQGDFSDEYLFDGVTWKINVRSGTDEDNVEWFEVFLYYDSDNQNEKNWICEVDAKYKLLNQSGDGKHLVEESQECYAKEDEYDGFFGFITWDQLVSTDNGYLKNDSIFMEVEFDFKYYDFSKKIPNFTDITINVEDTEFHLNKGVLCAKSTYFYDLFVNKKSQDTVIQLEDIKANDFCYLLASFNPFFNSVYVDHCEKLIEVAKKYGVPSLHHACEQFLLSDTEIALISKFYYADENGYQTLMKSCIESLETGDDITNLHANVEFSKLKETTKLRIMLRLLDIY